MIRTLETDFTFGPFPASITVAGVAEEAGATGAEAQDFIEVAWRQAETFTGRTFRETTAAVVLVEAGCPYAFTWPRWPFPSAVSVETLNAYTGEFGLDSSAVYVPQIGRISLAGETLYRLTAAAPIPAPVIPFHVRKAVENLALYQLVQHPARREFKAQSAGDSSLTREALMGVMYGSGAGAMLASEVRL